MTNKSQHGFGMLAKCPYCNGAYSASDAQMVKHESKRTIMHIMCSICNHAMLLTVSRSREGIMCAGILTDCDFEDAIKFVDADSVSIDDVINAHRSLTLDKFL
ncbi:MAG: hypothetical protein Q8P30_00755 [Candidatus Uhrbacteria bacterium]|nr:hypothetical protein [Candidatus Uhrbacteria bacterium]